MKQNLRGRGLDHCIVLKILGPAVLHPRFKNGLINNFELV